MSSKYEILLSQEIDPIPTPVLASAGIKGQEAVHLQGYISSGIEQNAAP